jgi:uncharacterized protein YbjT (DUF2867 family)
MSDERPVLVLGGTGNLGRAVVAALQRRGVPVRVLSRSEAGARRVLGGDVEVIEGDLVDGEVHDRCLEGVRGSVVAVSALSPGSIRQLEAIERDAILAFIERSQAAGVRRLVFHSVYEPDLEIAERFGLKIAIYKDEVERALEASTLDWTVLGQPPSMDIFFAMIRGGRRMIVPGGGPPALPTIATRDTGAISAEAVLRDDLGGRRFRMAGPEAMSFPEAARRIGAVWGRELRFTKVPLAGPVVARLLMTPLTPLSRPVAFAWTLIPYIRLMNAFPQALAAAVGDDHRLLVKTFDFEPTTLEMEAEGRKPGG